MQQETRNKKQEIKTNAKMLRVTCCVLRERRGFTLVEVLVTLSLFVTASFLAIGSYTAAVNLERKGAATRAVHQNISFLTEYLGKEIRNGRIDYGAYSSGQIPVGPQTYLHLRTRGTDSQQLSVSLQGSKIQVTKEGSTSFITDDNVKVNLLNFYVEPNQECNSTPCSDGQQRVTIVIEVESNTPTGPEVRPVKMNLQTTVSARLYDL